MTPRYPTLWANALETQFEALILTQNAQASGAYVTHPGDLTDQWTVDLILLRNAQPFGWGREPILATLQAARGIPHDTQMNLWNLDTIAAWWYFEEPLAIRTTVEGHLLRALEIGWIAEMPSVPGKETKLKFGVAAWVDPLPTDTWMKFSVMPSQVFTWHEDERFDDMLCRCGEEHQKHYGPSGKWKDSPQIGQEKYLAAVHDISMFVLAGLAWLQQKVVVQADAQLPRMRRKEAGRRMATVPDVVKIVQLRRTERLPPQLENGNAAEKREYSCRWVVDGHWRNQAIGAGRAEHRLTWVHPYVKGPEGKELRVPKAKVYEVRR